MPSDTNKYLDYSDKARKASDSEKLDSISSSSANLDLDLDTTNQRLATISNQLTAIAGKLDTIISKMPEQGA